MAAFLWTVVVLMAAALVAEILAMVGIALVAKRASRRATEIREQFQQKLEPSARLARELQQYVQLRMEAVNREGKDMEALVASRSQSIRAALDDTSRRAERIRLRLMGGVQTVDGEPGRRGIYRDIVEPMQAAGKVMQGLKIALWILRRVA